MPETIWNKYKIIKEINTNSNIKTYLTRIEPIVKEIIPKNIEDYNRIKEHLEELKSQLKIYDLIEENDKFYIVIDNNDKLLSKIDQIILSDKLNIQKEGIIEGHGNPITKQEILNLFEMEKSMCKIYYETIEKKELKEGKGSGFFCEFNNNCPIKYALFTNNHILNKSSIDYGNTINFEYLEKSFSSSSYNIVRKELKITEKRRVFTNEELDYTCIELFESDDIINYFKIEPNIFKYNKEVLKNNDIFILQFPNGKDISFSDGKILFFKDNKIVHNASTEVGSSGSPIIRRSKDNYIIGLHYGGNKKNNNNYLYNLGTPFDLIVDDIKKN